MNSLFHTNTLYKTAKKSISNIDINPKLIKSHVCDDEYGTDVWGVLLHFFSMYIAMLHAHFFICQNLHHRDQSTLSTSFPGLHLHRTIIRGMDTFF